MKLSLIAYLLIVIIPHSKSIASLKTVKPSRHQEITPIHTNGLKGDGIADDTDKLQKLLNDSSLVYLRAGTYLITRTLNIKANTKLIGERGTIIKSAENPVGTLLENGRYIFAEKADHSVIRNITFSQPTAPFHFAVWNNACIFLFNTKNFSIQNCIFDFHLSYGNSGMEAVWITGKESKNNIISENKINTLGLRYAENGADSTRVEANELIKSYANALTATGNNDTDRIIGCKILNNRIINAGRMGIEDWGNTDGSVIQGNYINGTGVDPKQAADGIALSAVGQNTTVVKNTIRGSQVYAIEVRGNYGVLVSDNIINLTPGVTGIILNYTFPAPAAHLPVAKIDGNKITGGKVGLHIFGDHESNASITNNVFINSAVKSLSVESGANTYLIRLKNNKFYFSIPNTGDRFAVFTYSKYKPETANQKITMYADTISFSTAASGGRGVDFGLVVRTDNAKFEGLHIMGNNNKNINQISVNAITAFGAKPVNAFFKNNRVSGAVVDLSNFSNIKLIANIFAK